MVITQKRAKITYGLSREGRKRIARKKWIGTGLLLGGIVLIVLAAVLNSSAAFALGVTGAALALASLFVFVLANPAGYDKGWFKLKGFCPQFLNTLAPFPYANPREIPELIKRR